MNTPMIRSPRRLTTALLVLVTLGVAACGSNSSSSGSSTPSSTQSSQASGASSGGGSSTNSSSSGSSSNGIPQGANAGDADADNHGGPSDGDGNI